ncbi:MAG TPA: hypothetical protein ENK48_03735 [Gammaproteobacteria bacterium]|nr:hypothetical protein [Gammaproteobacteria bacterium]
MNVNPVLFVILVELLALESMALVIISVLYFHRKYQYKNMVANLVDLADASEANRIQVLEKTLKDVFHEADEEAATKARQLATAESRFCKRLISAFVSRKHDILARLDRMTDELLSPYRTMISETAGEKVRTEKEMKKRVKRLRHTIDTLKEEKAAINQRLQATEKELASITSEYISAFKKEERLLQEQAQDTPAADESPDAAPQPSPADPVAEDADGGEDAILVTDGVEEEAPSSQASPTDEAPGTEGSVEETDGEVEDEDEEDELLKLEDIEDDGDPEILVMDDAGGDEETSPEEIAIEEEETTATAGTGDADGEEDSAESEDPDTERASGDGREPPPILEDVDMGEAPLNDELSAENAVRPQRSAAR